MRRSSLMTWIAGVSCGLALFVSARTMLAQNKAAAPTGRIAVVNVVQILNDYQRQKDLIDEIGKYQEKLQTEEKQRRDKLDKLKADLDKMDPDEPTLVARMREMLAQQVDYKNWGELAQLNMAREFGVWTVRIYKDMTKITEELAKRDGYDLVLYKGDFQAPSMDPDAIKEQVRSTHVLYASPAIDISQMVLDKLNADYRAQPKMPMLQM
jgi:Skp family chaperone for outer membrane proteins